MFNSDEEVINFIKDRKLPEWIVQARNDNDYLKALVLGIEFKEFLIKKFEKIESDDRMVARKKYAKDIRDLFSRVLEPRSNIFTASGGSFINTVTAKKDKLIDHLKHFKGQKSLDAYLAENFFRLSDTDPNGLIFIEYKGEDKIYPTYKSIQDIYEYESDGQLLNWVLFAPVKKTINDRVVQVWRFVDKEKDYTIYDDGGTWTVSKNETFPHPFGSPPGIILSDIQKMGSEIRISSLYPVLELAEEYAQDKSVKGLYKKFHGFPIHWRYAQQCRKCTGSGKDGKGNSCTNCGGKGQMGASDVTDIRTLEMPRDKEDPIVAPNPEGFISPDLETWDRMSEDLKNNEQLVESTVWGTSRVRDANNETATGRFLDVQPIMTKLDWYTNNVEFVHNQILFYVENWLNGKAKSKRDLIKIYGRRFIIESPDVLTERYNKDRESGANSTILDKDLDEILLAKYRTNPQLLDEMQKKRKVEPYVHQSLAEVNTIFGQEEAYKKVWFVNFWEDLGKLSIQNSTVEQLQKQFVAFFDIKKQSIVNTQASNQ